MHKAEGIGQTEEAKFKSGYLKRARADFVRLQRWSSRPEWYRGGLKNEDELIPGVPIIGGDLYPESPQIHSELLSYLEQSGYHVKDCTVAEPDEDRYFRRPSIGVQRQEGWYTGFASLKEGKTLRRADKCRSCHKYISSLGIQTDGHKCEKCGSVTYEEFPKGSQIRFSFWTAPKVAYVVQFDRTREKADSNELRVSGNLLRDTQLVVEHYDPKEKLLYCYAELAEVDKEGIDYGTAAETTYRRLADQIHGDRIVVSRDEIADKHGSRHNFDIVQLYKGKEFKEWDRLPIPESYSIYEPWHWAPAQPSPNLHNKIISSARMVEDKGYYYQDGRTAFYNGNIESMRRFVDHFTSLDLAKWDAMITQAPRSGPGMIDTVAHFCFEHPNVVNKPNIGNALIGLADTIAEKPKTRDQISAEIAYLKQEGFEGSVDELIAYMRSVGLIPTAKDEKKAKDQEMWIQDIWKSLNI